MNKELEALKGIKKAIAEHLHKQTGVSVEKHFEYLQNDTEIGIVEQALKRNEPMKVDLETIVTLKYGSYYKCPKCLERQLRRWHSYCPDCGQALDWSE